MCIFRRFLSGCVLVLLLLVTACDHEQEQSQATLAPQQSAATTKLTHPSLPPNTPTPVETGGPPVSSAIPATPAPAPAQQTIWLDTSVPAEWRQAVQELVEKRPAYILTQQANADSIRLSSSGVDAPNLRAPWVFALVAPFPTYTDVVSGTHLRSTWGGAPAGAFVEHGLMISDETLAMLSAAWGAPAAGALRVVPAQDLLTKAWAERDAWAIVPFGALEPRWKVLRIDGLSPLDRDLDLDVYPLLAYPQVVGPSEAVERFLAEAFLAPSNRDESRMTSVVMTGVTALTRATAWRMEAKGLTYPAQDIQDWLIEADITHVSNEVSFDPGCGPPDPVQEGLLFCSDPRYIQLLEHIGVDVVEMTGNHIGDAGVEHITPTLQMYRERGWLYFGGGVNLTDARSPAMFEHNGNNIAFLGCNPAGPPSVWATDTRPGATPCGDYEFLYHQISHLRADGYLPIVTLQYWEFDSYSPTRQQVEDFLSLAKVGAVIVQGSQAHHAQGFAFYPPAPEPWSYEVGGLVDYGPGNLFFDQMDVLGNRQEFINRHVFYQNRHISTELLTAMLEDWAKPRPMTEEERRELLEAVFAASGW